MPNSFAVLSLNYPASHRRPEAEERLKAMEQTNVAVTLPARRRRLRRWPSHAPAW
jgi:hypothetical protein